MEKSPFLSRLDEKNLHTNWKNLHFFVLPLWLVGPSSGALLVASGTGGSGGKCCMSALVDSGPRFFKSVYSHTLSDGQLHNVPFLIQYPSQSVVSSREDIPLILFLHGQSSRGDDIMQVASMAFPEFSFEIEIDAGDNIVDGLPLGLTELHPIDDVTETVSSPSCLPQLPAIILCPQCPRCMEWKKRPIFESVMALLDLILLQHRNHSTYNNIPVPFLPYSIDKNRVYVTGMSMGGLGSWMFAARYPEHFAAVVPICGGGPSLYAPILKDKPIWFFHSNDDNVIGVEETDKIVTALRNCGSTTVIYTRYEESKSEPASSEWMIGHNCWTKAYRNPCLWEWLFSKYLP